MGVVITLQIIHYTREAAEKFGELEGSVFTIVIMNAPAPDRNKLLLQFLAYKIKAEILKRVTEDCNGCQYDRLSQTNILRPLEYYC